MTALTEAQASTITSIKRSTRLAPKVTASSSVEGAVEVTFRNVNPLRGFDPVRIVMGTRGDAIEIGYVFDGYSDDGEPRQFHPISDPASCTHPMVIQVLGALETARKQGTHKQTQAQDSTITALTDALRPTATYTVESPVIPGAVVLTLENEESRKAEGSSIYATVTADGELAKAEIAVTIAAGGSAVNVVDMTEGHLGHNLRALVLRSRRPAAAVGEVREEPPVVVSDADLTFEQSASIQVLVEVLRPTVVIISVSPDAPGSVTVRSGRADTEDVPGSTVFLVLDARGDLVSVTMGVAGEVRGSLVESDETDGPLGTNLRAGLVRARHA